MYILLCEQINHYNHGLRWVSWVHRLRILIAAPLAQDHISLANANFVVAATVGFFYFDTMPHSSCSIFFFFRSQSRCSYYHLGFLVASNIISFIEPNGYERKKERRKVNRASMRFCWVFKRLMSSIPIKEIRINEKIWCGHDEVTIVETTIIILKVSNAIAAPSNREPSSRTQQKRLNGVQQPQLATLQK